MKKILIAIDDSPNATKAVEYVAQQFAGVADLEVGLVHVLPNLPADILGRRPHPVGGREARPGKGRGQVDRRPEGQQGWRRRSKRPLIC